MLFGPFALLVREFERYNNVWCAQIAISLFMQKANLCDFP